MTGAIRERCTRPATSNDLECGPDVSVGGYRSALLVVLAVIAVGCAAQDTPDVDAEEAVACSELGGGLVYVQYETEDGGIVGATLTDVDEDRAAQATELPEQALEVLEVRGWDREALAELSGDDDLSPQVQAKLEEMPSCLDDYLEANTVSDG